MRTQALAATLMLAFAIMAPTAFAEPAALQLDTVRSQQAQIRLGVESRAGVYASLSARDRDLLLAKQEQMLRVIEGKRSTAELNEGQRDEVFNSLEMIEALVNKSEDERVVCKRVATLGSNRKERVCRTVAQMREDQERAQLELSTTGSQRIR